MAGLGAAEASPAQPGAQGRLRKELVGAPRPDDRGAGVPVRVGVEGASGAQVERSVEAVGGDVVDDAPGGVEAELTAGQVEQLAADPSVGAVFPAPELRPHVVSQGVSAMDADHWHTGGTDGTGVDIAVVDIGFAGYEALVTAGELPADLHVDGSQCAGGIASSEHGTAVAEIVHDVAPGARIHLLCVDSTLDLDSPSDPTYTYLRDNDIEVANASFGVTTASRMDGGGLMDRAVAQSRRDGTLWTVSAGNLGTVHRGLPAGAHVLREFGPSYYVDLVNLHPSSTDDPYLEVFIPPGDGNSATAETILELTWDSWPTTRTDFDLFVSTSQDFTSPFAWSIQDQLSAPLPPVERIPVSNPYDHTWGVFVFVDSYHSPPYPADPTRTPVRLDLYADGALSVEAGDSSISIAEPGTSRGALTVGAVCHTGWTLPFPNMVRPYSGRGPTIDGRVKPDVMGPDGTASSVYGTASGCDGPSFTGTSASAPHVAGAAALLLDANPGLDPSEAERILATRALDNGAPGKDSWYGWGQVELGPAGQAQPPAGDRYTTAFPPTRLLDTRLSSSPVGPGSTYQLQVAGTSGVPVNATAVTLNVTAVSPTNSGYLTVFPTGAARPTASNLNFPARVTVANSVTVGLGPTGAIDIFNLTGHTHVLVDLAGWYGPDSSAGLANLAPIRAIDTRAGKSARITPGSGDLGGPEVLTTRVAGNPTMPEVPATATAVVANVTVTAPTRPGHLTVWPAGVAKPTVSTINFTTGQTIANLAVVPIGADGSISFAGSLGKLHVVVDVLGYYDAAATGRFVPLPTVIRIGDSRTGNGSQLNGSPIRVPSGGVRRFDAAHFFGVPGDAIAVAMNVTAVAPTAATGHLSVWGQGPMPSSSTLNFTRGAVVPNATFTSIGAIPGFLSGQVAVVNTSAGMVDVIVDMSGYFVGAGG